MEAVGLGVRVGGIVKRIWDALGEQYAGPIYYLVSREGYGAIWARFVHDILPVTLP